MAILPGRYLGSGGETGELSIGGLKPDACSTFTCFHCNKVTFVKPRCDPTELGGLCGNCNKLICPSCVEKRCCNPWEEQMKRMEAREKFRRDAGLFEY